MRLSALADAGPQAMIERSWRRLPLHTALRRWLREPLLHFLLLGVALFAVSAYTHRGRGGVESSKQIALGLDEVRQLVMYFESQWQRPPAPEELDRFLHSLVTDPKKDSLLSLLTPKKDSLLSLLTEPKEDSK